MLDVTDDIRHRASSIKGAPMSVELKVPEVGESVTEVYIGKWYKAEGDEVEQDEEVVELESEKATLDLRAPAAGVLAEILKQTGDPADVGEVIGRIEENGKQKPADKAKAEPKREQKAKSEERPPAAVEEKTATKRNKEPEAKKRPAEVDKEKAPEEEAETEAKRRAEKEPEKPPKEKVAEKVEKRAAPRQIGEELVEGARPEERVPMSPVRRRIAERLVEAQQNAALLTTFNEIDMTAVKELRAQFGESFEHRHGIRLGFMSFFVKATIGALEQCPELNAIIDEDEIVYRRYYDIGVALSTDKGLVVPVLRDADRMSFAQIEKAIDDFAAAARDGKLKVDDLQGGTFTITNGGVFGSLLSTPIVNPPQSGVLGMHAIQERPVAISDRLSAIGQTRAADSRQPTADSPAQIAIRPMMYVALTYDHRIVDGREAVTFLRRIKEAIEEPARLLIEV